jgi:hypothetical protein
MCVFRDNGRAHSCCVDILRRRFKSWAGDSVRHTPERAYWTKVQFAVGERLTMMRRRVPASKRNLCASAAKLAIGSWRVSRLFMHT